MSKVSVILTSYNHEKFLKEAIDSVLNQTFQDFELIIWDDASIDNSWEIIQSYDDPRIIAVQNETNSRGVYGINKAVTEVATGEYIAIHHSDDVWMPDKLDKQVKLLNENSELGAVFSNAEIIREDGSLLNDPNHPSSRIFNQKNRKSHEWLRYFFELGNCLCHPSVLIRKEVYKNIGPYNRLLGSLGDFEMWVRVCTQYNIYVISEKLIQFRVLDNEQNTSGHNPTNLIRGNFEYPKVLDTFCSIDNLTLFNQVFESNLTELKDLPMFLVQRALQDPRIFIKSWGLQKAYSLLSQDYTYYSTFINNIDFIKLSGTIDIHQIIGMYELAHLTQEFERLRQESEFLVQHLEKNKLI